MYIQDNLRRNRNRSSMYGSSMLQTSNFILAFWTFVIRATIVSHLYFVVDVASGVNILNPGIYNELMSLWTSKYIQIVCAYCLQCWLNIHNRLTLVSTNYCICKHSWLCYLINWSGALSWKIEIIEHYSPWHWTGT